MDPATRVVRWAVGMRGSDQPVRLIAVLGIGWVVSTWTVQGFLGLARDGLHFLCGWTPEPDFPNSWTCAHGRSYVGVAVGTTLVLTAVLAAGLLALLVHAVRRPRPVSPRRERLPTVLLLVLAVFPGGYALVATAYAAAGADPAGWRAQHPDGLWWGVVGPAAIVILVASIAALLAAALPWRRVRRAAAVVSCVVWLTVPSAEQGLAWVAPLSLALVVTAVLLSVADPDPFPASRSVAESPSRG